MWVTPRTWVTSEKVSATMLNLHLRDNLNFLYAPPRCKLTREGGFQVQNNNPVIDWAIVLWDTDSMANTEDRTKISINTAGYYFAATNVMLDLNIAAGAITLLYIHLNTLSIAHSNDYFQTGYHSHSAQTGRSCAVDDYLRSVVNQTTAGADTPVLADLASAQLGAGLCFLAAVWIGGS